MSSRFDALRRLWRPERASRLPENGRGSLYSLLTSPFLVMSVVVLMFVVKSVVKISVGNQIHSPMIASDGWHNVADIVGSLSVIVVIVVAMRPKSAKYPFGRGNIEFFASLVIGLLLLGLSFDFAKKSLAGIAAHWDGFHHAYAAMLQFLHEIPIAGSWLEWLFGLPQVEGVDVSGGMFLVVVLIIAGSFVLSLVASRAQIAVGKRSGHTIVHAAGKETASDSRVELVTLIGILLEHLLGYPWLEYPFALAVSLIIAHTGYRLCLEAMRVLHGHSLGAEYDQCIRELSLKVPGVSAVTQLVTFRMGHTAQVIATLSTLRPQSIPMQTFGVQRLVKEYVLSLGFLECKVDLTFEPPPGLRHRVCYAVVCDASERRPQIKQLASTLDEATHLVVCDMEHDAVDRCNISPKPLDVVAFLGEKRVERLYLFDEETQRQSWPKDCPIKLVAANVYVPLALGIVKQPVL